MGGNDALKSVSILSKQVNDVSQAFHIFSEIKHQFQLAYLSMLNNVLDKCKLIDCTNITVCTIYNKIPGLGDIEKTALSIFNDVITEIAFSLNLNLIDLRNICNEDEDYSIISPIEPSLQGGNKITDVIVKAVHRDYKKKDLSLIYGLANFSKECKTPALCH